MSSDPLLDAFDPLARRRPEAPLVARGGQIATRGQVAALAEGLAARWRPSPGPGPEPGTLVALEAANGPAFLAALLALRRLRLPALLLDPRNGLQEGARAARSLGAGLHLRCPEGFPDSVEAFEATQPAPAPAATRLDETTAVVKLTSGSTGHPRGVVVPCAALVADDAALAATMGLAPDERILAALPLSHSYGLASVALPALIRGSLLVVPEDRSPLAAMAAARRGGVTFLPTVPAYLQALLKRDPPPPWPGSLCRVITAGAPLTRETAARFRAVYGHPVQVFYGTSETGGITFDREGGAAERGTLGTPVDGVEIILEPLDPARPEGPRTVTVSSPAVASSYLDPSDNFPDSVPAEKGRLADRTFRTQDLAAFDGAELRWLGRADDLVNVKGKKVNPREVEAVLRAVPGVEDAAVLGIPCGGREILRAVVAGEGLTTAGLQEACRGRLPDYKIPRSLLLVPCLPRTPRGKLDRAALRSLTG